MFNEPIQQLIDNVVKTIKPDDMGQYVFEIKHNPFDKTQLHIGKNGIYMDIDQWIIDQALDEGAIYYIHSYWYGYSKS